MAAAASSSSSVVEEKAAAAAAAAMMKTMVTGAVSSSSPALFEEMKVLKEMQEQQQQGQGQSNNGGTGTVRKAIHTELWHACAGPLVYLPQIGSLVYYFPQGHSEQVAASTKRSATAQIPNYPNLPSQLLCQVHNVTLHADRDTDEIFAQMSLQPVKSEKDIFQVPDFGLRVSKQPTEYFCKTLTASDTSTHGGFSVPRRAAEKLFPALDYTMQPPSQELVVRDLHENTWTFRHIYRGQPKRHLLTTGWSVFVGSKRLRAGDSVLFIRDEKSQLMVGVRRANRQQTTTLPSSVLSADSMHIGVLAAAAHASVNRTPFTVFYNPRACPADFVIPINKYRKAIHGTQISVGMRFGMMFETEESGKRRYMGTIVGINDLDPLRWPASKWRNLQVEWDEPGCGDKQNRVSAWDIETPESLFLFPSLTSGFKRPFPPTATSFLGGGEYEWGSLLKRPLIHHTQPPPQPLDQIGIGAAANLYPYPAPPPAMPNLCSDQLLKIMLLSSQQNPNYPLSPPQHINNSSSPMPPYPSTNRFQQQQQQHQNQPSSYSSAPQQQQLPAAVPMPMENYHHPHRPPSMQITNNNNHHPTSSQSSQQTTTQKQQPTTTDKPASEAVTSSKQLDPRTAAARTSHDEEEVSQQLPSSSSTNKEEKQQQQQQQLLGSSYTTNPSSSLNSHQHQTQPSSNGSNNAAVQRQQPPQQQQQQLQQQQQQSQQQSALDDVQQHHQFHHQSSSSSQATTTPPMLPPPLDTTTSPHFHHQLLPPSLDNMIPDWLPSSTNATLQSLPGWFPQSPNTLSMFGKLDPFPSSSPSSLPLPDVNPILLTQDMWGDHHQHHNFASFEPPTSSIGGMDSTTNDHSGIYNNNSCLEVDNNTTTPNVGVPNRFLDPSAAVSAAYGAEFGGASGNNNMSFKDMSSAGFQYSSDCCLPAATNFNSSQDLQSQITSAASLVDSQAFSFQELQDNSGGTSSSNVDFDDSSLLHTGSWQPVTAAAATAAPPPPPLRSFTKVQKAGSVGRSIDVTSFKSYDELRSAIECMFGLDGLLCDPRGGSGWKLVYVDFENDVLLVGDDPWEEFVSCVRCIRILSPSEVKQMSEEGLQLLNVQQGGGGAISAA